MTSLKVFEAYPEDVTRGIARIDIDSLNALRVSDDEVIEIKGKRRTVARPLPLPKSDRSKGIIRIDGLVRSNAGVAIDDMVVVRKIKAVTAEKVVVKPHEAIPPIDERYLADALESVPVIKDDCVLIPYFGGRLSFQVVDVTSSLGGEAAIVSQKTMFSILNNGPTMIPMTSIIESMVISDFIGLEIEDSVRQENKDTFLVLRIHLTFGGFIASGEFQKRIEKDSDMQQIFSRYKEMAEQELHSANEKLLNPTESKESQFEMLGRLKFNILERWAHAF